MTATPRRLLFLALTAAAALVLAFVVTALIERLGTAFMTGSSSSPALGGTVVAAPSLPQGGNPAVISLHDAPRPLPEIRFEDGSGNPVTLADFGGKVVLLNIWATWCGPCRHEMPTLDRLQETLGGPGFEVVALSIDRAGIGVVEAFYAEIGIAHLARYIAASAEVARQVGAVGLPTTLLVDRDGREIARHVGPAEWDHPQMVAFLRQQLSENPGAPRPGAATDRAGLPAGALVTVGITSTATREGSRS